MTTRKSDRSGVAAPLDVKTLLASVEAAPPVDAAEVVAAAERIRWRRAMSAS